MGSKDTYMRTCPACKGKGVRYTAFNIRTRKEMEVSRATYFILPESEDQAAWLGKEYCQGEASECRSCGGTGQIEDIRPECEYHPEDRRS